MNATTTSAAKSPFGEHIRLLMEFLTGRCALSEPAAAECLKAFLLAKTADKTFHQKVPREATLLVEFLKNSLRDFAKSWLAERQASRQTESRDPLGFARTIWTDLRVANAPDDEI